MTPQQQSMFDTFEAAETERSRAHLPETIGDAVPVLRDIIARYDAAMRAGDQTGKEAAVKESEELCWKLESLGVGPYYAAVADMLEPHVAAPAGTIPLWGQTGEFEVDVRGCRARIEWAGIYGLCEIQFAAHAIDWNAPFLSDTGYRSFMTHSVDCTGGAPPVDELVRDIVTAHIGTELKGKLKTIEPRYVELNQPEEPSP